MDKKRKGENKLYKIDIVVNYQPYVVQDTIFERASTYKKYILTKLKELRENYEQDFSYEYILFINGDKKGSFKNIDEIMDFVRKDK